MTAGANVIPVKSSIDSCFALPPIESFEQLIGPNTKAIVISNPGNPTGYLYSKSELEKLRDLVLKYDLYLFADEVYREFCYDGEEFFSAMQLEGLDQHVVLIDSVSKRYSMCGARIGALVTRNKEVIQVARCDQKIASCHVALAEGDLALIRARKALDVFETAHDHIRSNNALFEYGKAQVLLENYEEGLNTLDQVLTVATDEEPKDFEFIVDIETSMAAVMRILGRNTEANEIDRRLVSVREALADETESQANNS
jgi:aspartate/methionine/tyrosine aminotransferase